MKFYTDINGIYQGGFDDGIAVASDLIEVPTPPDHAKQRWNGHEWEKIYQVYNYLPDSQWNEIKTWSAWPCTIDFITGLNRRLFPKNTFVFGELQETIYYESATYDSESGVMTYSIPVVKEHFTYTRDEETGFPIYRENEIQWYFADGTLDETNVKTLQKYYTDDPVAALSELATRRDNNIKNIIGALIPLALATTEGISRNEILDDGRAFFNAAADERQTYILDGNLALVDLVRNDSSLTWLDNDISGFTPLDTIRHYIIYQLTMGTESS